MKKLFRLFCALLAALAPLSCAAAQDGTPPRRMTLMVYMCGSNLESSAGSATADIMEMMEAAPEGRETAILVMTGGSDISEGTGYFQKDSAGIYEIASGGRIRRVLPSPENMNMGDQDTLASFLRYGQENRPAQSYALILWDHGGGPLEGVCWDETSGMDHLSLREVTGALDEALTQKLEWIGFDACLRGSLEVAGQLIPYANYMIASQEMEPPFGWNYSFLREIGSDADGAETGRRIVDAFFDGQEDSKEILTLSCTDLAAAGEAIGGLDPVFIPLTQRLDREQYLSLSALRMSATGFGKADPGYSATGYDLVDARDLIARMEPTDDTGRLLSLLEHTVVYSRSNEEGANGLTLYYPYANKESYLKKWKDGYGELSFSPGYQAYVGAFGGMLTGEALFRWLDLIPDACETAPDGSFRFTLPLTEEQAENTVSAQLLIVRDTTASRLGDSCVLIASCRAEKGEDNALHAVWDGRCLYAEEEDGSLAGPVSFRQTDDGKRNTIIARYGRKGGSLLDGQNAFIEVDPEDTSEYPEILRIRVWDEATESFSSRMAFSEEEFGSLAFWNLHRAFPGIGAENTLPDMEKWAESSSMVVAQGFYLPQKWRLRYIRQDSGRQLYAMFRLLDSQQQVVCSVPVAGPNPYRTVSAPVSGTAEDPEIRAELRCTVDTSPDLRGLQLEWTFENKSEEKTVIRVQDPVLNGTRKTESVLQRTVRAGETIYAEKTLSFYDAAFLEELESVSGILEIMPENGEKREIPFAYTFADTDLSALQPEKAAPRGTSLNGLSLRVCGLEPDGESGWNLYLLAENGSAGKFRPAALVLNGIAFPAGGDYLDPGQSQVFMLHAGNRCDTASLKAEEGENVRTCLEDNLLQKAGVTEVRELSLWADTGEAERQELILPLADPIRPDSADAPAAPETENLPVLAENNVFRIRLRGAAAGEKGLGLALEVANLSGRWACPEICSCAVNGQPVTGTFYIGGGIPPHTVQVAALVLQDIAPEEEETGIREITLGVYERKKSLSADAVPAVLRPAEPFRPGQEGESRISGGDFAADPAILPDDPDGDAEANPQPLNLEVLVPENAFAYRIEADTGLTPEEAADMSNCKAAVLRKNSEGYLQILTLQDLKPDENGKVILKHPGLFPTVNGDPEIGVMTYLLRMDETEVLAEVFLGASIGTESMDTVELSKIRWILDREKNSAEVISFEQDHAPYSRQSDLLTAKFLTYELSPPEPLPDGSLPHLADMERRSDFLWYINVPGIRLENKPLQFALRPFGAEDELYLLISVVRTDKSRYSLPIVPFPPAEEQK